MNKYFKSVKTFCDQHEFKCVSINKDKLKAVADEWAGLEERYPDWRRPVFMYPDDPMDFIQFIGIATAINFCYAWPSSGRKFFFHWKIKDDPFERPGFPGADGMVAALTRAMEEGFPVLDPAYLAEISAEDMDYIFYGDPEIPLLHRRREVFHEIGRVLPRKYGGHFANLLKAAKYRAFFRGAGVCERLVNDFPIAYGDSCRWDGQHEMVFAKKAQLMALIYHGRSLSDPDMVRLADIHKLSPIVDYQIPRTLRSLGILSYTGMLAESIEKYQELPEHCLGEIEIRAATAMAVYRLYLEISRLRKRRGLRPIIISALDYPLWQAGRTAEGAHHITNTNAY